MDKEKEYKELKQKLKELSASRYKRFNVLIPKETFSKLEKEAKKRDKSKAKMLSEMIKKYN